LQKKDGPPFTEQFAEVFGADRRWSSVKKGWLEVDFCVWSQFDGTDRGKNGGFLFQNNGSTIGRAVMLNRKGRTLICGGD